MDDAVKAVKEGLQKRNLKVGVETKLANGSMLIPFLDASRTEKILAEDRMLLGLIPMVVMVEKKDEAVSIGIMNPQLLGGTQAVDSLEATIGEMEKDLKQLVNEAAGVSEPKIEKVKLYSTATCPYCKMEKEYLEKNNIAFDLVMVDADRKAAEEMIRKSGQTGVPQTEVIYDSGDYDLILGFDKGRLNQLLSIGK
jgi:glutaredoxin